MFKILIQALVTALICAPVFSEKVLIITSAYNRPDFIELQHKTFQKFLRDDYEFVVFNDANQKPMQRAIEGVCARLNIRCINIPQRIHDMPYLERWPGEGYHLPAVRNCNVVQYALNNLGFAHNGIVAIFDSDMFLVRDFSFKECMADHPLVGVYQPREQNGKKISYLWIGLAFLDMARLPDKTTINFNCGRVDGLSADAGGYTHYYMKAHPEIPVRFIDTQYDLRLACSACLSTYGPNAYHGHFDPEKVRVPCVHNDATLEAAGLDGFQIEALRSGLFNVEFYLNGTFFHYRAGTNWDHRTKGFHERNTLIFNKYFEKMLNN